MPGKGKSRSSSPVKGSAKKGKSKSGKKGKKSAKVSPVAVDVMSPAAMLNLHYIAHTVPDALDMRGFGWAGGGKKKKKGGGKKKKKK